MSKYRDGDLDSWSYSVELLHGNSVASSDVRKVSEAVASMLSAFGDLNAPDAIVSLITQAIESGYGAALRDLRDGEFDDEIVEWRGPFLELE